MEKNIIQFERMLKNIIYNEYETFLPRSKKELLKREICLIDPKKYDTDDNDFQCLIIRNILKFIINANCKQTIEINRKHHLVEYGEYLTNGLIEYYTFLICKKYDIEYVKDPKYKENFEFVSQMSDYLDLNKYVFKENAYKLLSSVQFTVFKNRYDSFIKKDFMMKQLLKENYNSIERISEIFIIYINGKIAIKIIDNENNSHVVKINCPCDEVVLFTYMDNINEYENNIYRFLKLLKQKDIDFVDYDMFVGNILEEYGVEESVPEIINIDDKPNNVKYNDNEILVSNKDIVKIPAPEVNVSTANVKTPISVFNEEMHKQNAPVVNIPKKPIIIIEDKKFETVKQEIVNKEIKPEEVITAKEYEEICMKAVKGKKLTNEDYQKIAIFDKFHYGKEETGEEVKPRTLETKIEKPVVHKQPIQEKKKKPKIINVLIVLVVIGITVALGILLGKLLYNYMTG